MINPELRVLNLQTRRDKFQVDLNKLITEKTNQVDSSLDIKTVNNLLNQLDLWVAELSFIIENCGLFIYKSTIVNMCRTTNDTTHTDPNLLNLKELIKIALTKYPSSNNEEFDHHYFHINKSVKKINEITNNVIEVVSGNFNYSIDKYLDNNFEPLPESNIIFVIMSLKQELDEVYEMVIESAINNCKLISYRVDREEPISLITKDIVDKIKTAKIVICDLTFERPNCYYEVGFAAGLRKRIILTCRSDHDPRKPERKKDDPKIHFDLDSHKITFWNKNNLVTFRRDLINRINSYLP